jgi:hypothetical protein
MKTIIAGSRIITKYEDVLEAISLVGWNITEVVSGGAKGVDKFGERYAEDHKIPLKRFPADWNKYGRGAGVIRNNDMAEYADALIAVWDLRSKGTKHMIDIAMVFKLDILIHIPKGG